MKEADFDAVLRQGTELQHRFSDKRLVAVGGTAAALHCGHRFSLDVDCATPRLRPLNEMNANRSTEGESALRWLNIVQRGSTEDWKVLYRACENLGVARHVAASLAWRDPDLLPSARLWRFLRKDLHRELEVNLHEEDAAIGV